MTVYLDLSQFVQDPCLTGIQRAERALIRHWPGPAPLVPCAYDGASGTMRTLPSSLMQAIRQEPVTADTAAELRRLTPYLTPKAPIVPDGARLLCAELFGDPGRAAYYHGLAGGPVETFWLVYDFLPWLRPAWFEAGTARRLMPYLRAIQTVRQVAFISQQVRDDYLHRVVRRADAGPVIPMGADGLGLERQHWTPERQDVVMLGTIEPRKNVVPAIRAFQRLWADGSPARLTLIGQVTRDAHEEGRLIGQLAREKRFRHLSFLADEGVRHAMRHARAMLFPSEGEGYGIPAMEGLHAGIPAIVAASLPALDGLPALGQIRLDRVDAASIAGAVQTLCDDDHASRLWAAAAMLTLPTWQDFAHGVARWIRA